MYLIWESHCLSNTRSVVNPSTVTEHSAAHPVQEVQGHYVKQGTKKNRTDRMYTHILLARVKASR